MASPLPGGLNFAAAAVRSGPRELMPRERANEIALQAAIANSKRLQKGPGDTPQQQSPSWGGSSSSQSWIGNS
eukprot:2670531-Alexandrium_andersonii.AAC.1